MHTLQKEMQIKVVVVVVVVVVIAVVVVFLGFCREREHREQNSLSLVRLYNCRLQFAPFALFTTTK